ncbi:MAG TPA: glycosyltransferase family 39 protein [Saprospiraceae bacterium]|nr:glycosyltransferase family 39 protein [Saprospiraceae bacterium]
MIDSLTSLSTFGFPMFTPHRGILILAMLFVVLNLIGLDRSSVVWVDEVTLNEPAKELALHGKFRSLVFSGYDGFDDAYFGQPPGQPLITAGVYRFCGFGIWQTRVPVVLFAACAVVALYFIALYFLNNQRLALLSSILFALNPQFIHTARSGRMDAQCLFFAFIGIFLFLRSSTGRRSYSTLCMAGLAIGVSGTTHPIGIVWALAIASLILFTEKRLRVSRLIFFSLSSAIPAVAWLIVALRTPAYFNSQFLALITNHTAEGSIISRFIEEGRRYAIVYRAAPLLVIVLISALIWFSLKYKSDTQKKRQLIILVAVPFALITVFMTKSGGSWFDMLHPVSMMMIVVGAFAGLFLSADVKHPTNSRQNISYLAVSLLLVNLIFAGIGARYILLAYQWNERDYKTIAVPIRAMIPQGSVIFGTPEVWYAAEWAGASLRMRGQPDARIHDFVITKMADGIVSLPGFRKIAEVGKEFPAVFGRFKSSATDYRMVIWEASRRNHTFLQFTRFAD